MKNLMAVTMVLGIAAQADSMTWVYNADSLMGSGWPGTVLQGQDNWVHAGITQNATSVLAGVPGDNDLYVSSMNRQMLSRTNDANWSYAIPADAYALDIEYDVRIGNGGGGWWRSTEVGSREGGTTAFLLGWDGYNSANRWRLRGTGVGTDHYGTQNVASSGSEFRHVRMHLDLLANGGEGAATVYTGPSGGPATLPTGITNAPLALKSAGLDDVENWDGLWLDVQFGAQLDNIAITAFTVPEPSTFALAAFGLLSLGLVGWRRRRR
jgi:hypothetical protein